MNNHKMNLKTKDDKRRLLLEKRKGRLPASLNAPSTAYDMAYTKGFNKRIISLVLVVAFLLSTVGIGVNILAKAEDNPYSQEDEPIPMRVMVNDELLKNSEAEDFIVFFPSALIENGSIEKGIDFEKVNDDGELLVNSIHHYVDSFLFGDQKENNEINDSYYQSAIVQYPDNSYSFIVKVLINEAGQYVYEKTEEEGIFYTLGDDEYFALKFRTNSPDEQTINSESNEENQRAIDNDNKTTDSEWLSIPGIKESKRIMLPAKASSPTKTGAKLSRVTDIKVYINGAETYLGESYMVTLPAGAIADNLSSAVFSKELPNNAEYLKATVFNADTGKEVEIIRVGTLSGTNEVYYSLNDDPDTGILLGEDDYIILHYGLTYTVSYQVNDSEIITGQGGINATGGTITGSDTAVYGTDLFVLITTAKYYSFDSIQYKVGEGSYQTLPTSNDSSVVSCTVPGNTITDNLLIKLNTSTKEQFTITGLIENGTMADVSVIPGGTATITLYSNQELTYNGKTYYYLLNALKIDDEEIQVPTSYTTGASSTDTMENGSRVTIEKQESTINNRNKYAITITDVQNDMIVQAYFRTEGTQVLYLKGLRGIHSTAASRQWPAYYAFEGLATENAYSGYNYFYTFDNNSSGQNAYRYYTDYNIETTRAEEGAFVKTAGFNITVNEDFLLLVANRYLNDMQSHSIYLYKVKPGYNPNTVQRTYLKGNYLDFNSIKDNVVKAITLTTTNNLETIFNSSKAKFHHWKSTATIDANRLGANWFNYPTPDELNLTTERVGNLFTKVNLKVSWNNSFFPTAYNNAYRKGFYIDDLTYYNQDGTKRTYSDSNLKYASPYYVRYNMSLNLNAYPYLYQINYRLNGGEIEFNNDEVKYSRDSTGALDHNSSFYEINRHVISKEALTLEDYNGNEFDGVEGNVIVTPKTIPFKDGYRFTGWKLYSATRNKYGTEIYPSNTAVPITEQMCGDDTAHRGNEAQYLGAMPSASDGFADGDETSNTGMYFTFVAQWEPVSDNEKPIKYTITTYKEVDSTTEGAILNANNQRYYIVEKEITGTGVNNKKVVYMNELNPSTNETSYILDEDISTSDTVLTDTNRSFVYYYNLARSVIVKEETGGTFGVKAKKFPISISLVNNSNPGIPVTATYEVEYIITSNEITGQEHAQKGEATFDNGSLISVVSETGNTIPISLKHGEQIRFIGIPEGYILTVHESDESKGDYSLYFDESEEEDEDGSKSLVVSADDRNNMILIRNEYDLVPQEGLLGSRNHYVIIYILAGVATISAGAGAAYVYRKKDEFVER